uniref:Phosphatidylcholine transfer protein n=1 Tax=Riptortus pedestris TaxID=329032 RepID=R4WE05_RIPPE|nr:conserved hypothetical protein [Riptortus pedestris]
MIVPFIAFGRFVLQNNRSSNLPKKRHFSGFLKHNAISEKFHYDIRNLYSAIQEDFRKSCSSIKQKPVLVIWTKHLPQISKALRSSSVSIVRHCLKQIECVVAQRVRRGQQMITLYTRLWDEKGFRFLFLQMKRIFHKRSKHLILGASFIAFDWENERIPIDDLKRHVNEMKICHILRKKAFTGEEGEGTQATCTEGNCRCPECDATADVHCWEPFIKEEDLTVWKMEETNHPGSNLYCYKMYGKYSDVTADDFLEVFLDTENRTKWDVHAALLKVIDSDPSTQSSVIYWETKWPTLFSNRDYVFKRRYYKDEKNKVIVIMNKSTDHPMYPPTNSKARVTEFWSYMVIKANTEFNEPGIEFSLTYFDNPGISLPSVLTLWVTVQGMPEYLKRLRVEALKISEKRKLEGLKESIDESEGKFYPNSNHQDEKAKEEGPDKGIFPKKSKEPHCNEQTETSPSHTSEESPISTYDLVLLISSYMHKVKSSLWL